MTRLKQFTMLSWLALALGGGAFLCAEKFPDKVPMSDLVFFGGIGLVFASSLISAVALALTARTRDPWRPWAIVGLGIEVVCSLALVITLVYAFLHLPVH